MKKVIMSIGIPGSGKSTTLKAFVDRSNKTQGFSESDPKYVLVRLGDFRAELMKRTTDKAEIDRMRWPMAYDKIKEFLDSGKVVVLDSTQTDGIERRACIERLRELGANKIVGLFVSTDKETALERARARARKANHIPSESDIDSRLNSLATLPPSLSDGFDSLFTIETPNNEQRISEVKIRKLLK